MSLPFYLRDTPVCPGPTVFMKVDLVGVSLNPVLCGSTCVWTLTLSFLVLHFLFFLLSFHVFLNGLL